ncbi:MAG TPA: hypothetical protein VNH38_08150 [Candidatus Dormibacteraeota bacterium]|nr:hypothetical protein [Candidatus Dormibacteraeota bacterium]
MQKPKRGLKRRARGSARLSAGAWLSRRFRSGSPGQGMVEYSLILLLVAIVVMVIFVVLGHRVSDMYSNISNGFTASG